ncbi:hypothetical protein PVT71_17595 [Salipiger sp. H15]|uniref:Curlin associated repeat-containing protein n=1 Tax=Alloyangia sp. H15 TaxID=3029062 RepID=A0AAU8AQ31_9RHOB
MSVLKKSLVVSAIAILAGGAHADSNAAYLEQTGNGNSASVSQLGSGARAGDNGLPGAIVQNGNGNDIAILQNNGGTAGAGGNYIHASKGIDQLGDNNTLAITQTFGSRVFEVQQDATAALSPSADPLNVVTITQTGNMAVSRVNQTYTGSGAAGTANEVSITQTGSQYQLSRVGDSNGFSNEVLFGQDRGVFQSGESNSVSIVQQAANHAVLVAKQSGTGNALDVFQGGGHGNLLASSIQSGSDNVADLYFSGGSNGQLGFSAGGAAEGASVLSASLTQDGAANSVSLTVFGNENQFGFAQIGNGNTAAGTQTGDLNEIAVSQTGDLNIAVYAQLGTGNIAGIVQ